MITKCFFNNFYFLGNNTNRTIFSLSPIDIFLFDICRFCTHVHYSAHHVHVWCLQRPEVTATLELELQMAGSLHVGSGNQT